MGYIALAVGHLLSPCYDKKKRTQVHFTFRPGGRSCTRVIVILFWREINLRSWRFFKVPRLLILAGNCSISLGLTKIFVPRYKGVWWLAGGLLPYLYLGTISTPSWRSKSVPEFKLVLKNNMYVTPPVDSRYPLPKWRVGSWRTDVSFGIWDFPPNI
jgi:hypothetical protein